MIHSAGPAGSHTSQPGLSMGYKVSDKTGFFLCNYFATGKKIKLFFPFPAIQ
jgi:hypothetical protein